MPVGSGGAGSANPWILAPRGPVSAGRSPAYPKPEPIRRTCCPARSPQALHCVTEAAMVRALGRVVEQGIIACDHGGVDACLQVSQPTQHMEGPPTDRLEDRGNVRMEG